MISVKVKATITEDNTGIKTSIPILITEQGELSTVTDYLLHLETSGKSIGTINRVLRATSKLVDFMATHCDIFDAPNYFFKHSPKDFTQELLAKMVLTHLACIGFQPLYLNPVCLLLHLRA